MIQYRLINEANLLKIAEYKLALREIIMSNSTIKVKIAMMNSFKQHIKLKLEGELKYIETASMHC
jgi:hypothetical protein